MRENIIKLRKILNGYFYYGSQQRREHLFLSKGLCWMYKEAYFEPGHPKYILFLGW